jgi:hypothetical protein
VNKSRACCSAGLLAAFLAGCGENPIAPRAQSEPAWKLLATGETFIDVWGCSSNAVFALGEASLFFYNGSSWTVWPDPPVGSRAIWGTSPRNPFVIAVIVESGRWHADVYRYDGRSWELVLDRPYPLATLRDIWGSSDHDIFAVGDRGTILHYDGSAWCQMSSGTGSDLRCLWGTSSTDVYAAGAEGSVLHYDGSTWTTMSADPSWELSGIWASSNSDVYCVSNGDEADFNSGAVFHYDGSAWAPVANTLESLWNIWGSSSTDIFAVGNRGTLLHYDGITWSETQVWGLAARSIWGSSSSDVFVVGGYDDNYSRFGSLLSHYDGATWRSEATTLVHPAWTFPRGVGGSSATDVYFVGVFEDGYPSLRHFNGSSFDAWVTLQYLRPWTDVWGAAPDAVFVVGADCSCVDLFDGSFSGWMAQHAPSGHEWSLETCIGSVWALSRVNAFAAGEGGRIYHYDGSSWNLMTTGTTSYFLDIWGSSETDLFAVGQAGTIVHYDGSSWALMPTETSNDLDAVWGSSGTDVYTVGDSGTILHYDGVQWKAVPSMTQNRLTGVWGSSDRDVYVVGGIILHYDGKTWKTVSTTHGAHKVWGSGAGDVYVTEWNRILHYGVQ